MLRVVQPNGSAKRETSIDSGRGPAGDGAIVRLGQAGRDMRCGYRAEQVTGVATETDGGLMTDYVDREHEAEAIRQVRESVASHDIQSLPAEIGRWRAAVLIALLPYDDPAVVLTVRSDQVEHHKGEVSFPGGALDSADEHPMAAALREADEEVGIRAEHVDVLGEQSHYRTTSDFHVTPYVGLVDRAPYPFRPLTIEVGEIITPRLSHLLDPVNIAFERRERDGRVLQMREYWFDGHCIFGATATMLGRFLDDLARLRGLPIPHPDG